LVLAVILTLLPIVVIFLFMTKLRAQDVGDRLLGNHNYSKEGLR
jgi:hypothetical protein